MHQNRWRLGLRPRPRWGSLQRSPRPPSCDGLGWKSGKISPPPNELPRSATDVTCGQDRCDRWRSEGSAGPAITGSRGAEGPARGPPRQGEVVAVTPRPGAQTSCLRGPENCRYTAGCGILFVTLFDTYLLAILNRIVSRQSLTFAFVFVRTIR